MTAQINGAPPGVLEHLHPDTLEIETNVRIEAGVTKQFVASVAENGVLVPVTAVRGADGAVRVRTGQRRTLAARQAGLATIPVYVLSGDGADQTVERVVDQIVENDHRDGLSVTDRVHGIQTLLDAGMSVTKTAKALSRPASYVKASQAVAGSQAAIEALASGQLTLTEAAAITEFDGDEPALQRLLSCGSYSFEHTLSMLREQRESAQRMDAAEQEWRDKGYTVLDGPPASWDPDFVEWGYLLKDGQPVDDDDDAVIADPKHWAVILWEDTVLTNTETGEEVYDDQVDWGTRGNPDQQPGEGQLHVDAVTETEAVVPEFYYCIDLAGAGLTANERFLRFSGQGAQQLDPEGGNSDSGNQVDRVDEIGPVLVDEKVEAEKRERRKVLALNKLGDAALGVRRQFVKSLLARKTPPKGAAMFVARMLAGDSYLLSNHRADEVTAELLGVERIGGTLERVVKGVEKLVADLPDKGDSRAQVITLGLVLGALEGRTPKDAWRQDQWSRDRSLKPYLEFLAANGYELAPVEQVMVGKKKADKVFDQYLAEQ